MSPRRKYRIRIEVEHTSREAAVLLFEDIVFKLKADHWPEENVAVDGSGSKPKTDVAVGPLGPSVIDRLTALEAEFETRLGGISEENQP